MAGDEIDWGDVLHDAMFPGISETGRQQSGQSRTNGRANGNRPVKDSILEKAAKRLADKKKPPSR